MAANSTALIPVEEYLHSSYEPDCDYVDGVLEARSVGEGPHSFLQIEIANRVHAIGEAAGVRPWPELRVQVRPGRYRVPDICVTVGRAVVKGILREPPLLCVEILSSEDRLPRVLRRCDDYVQFGVRHIWIVDPFERVGYTYSAQGLQLSGENKLSTSDPAFEIDLNPIFEEFYAA